MRVLRDLSRRREDPNQEPLLAVSDRARNVIAKDEARKHDEESAGPPAGVLSRLRRWRVLTKVVCTYQAVQTGAPEMMLEAAPSFLPRSDESAAPRSLSPLAAYARRGGSR
jgi:hypothetical protein